MVKPNGALPGITRLAIHDNQQNQIAESPMTGVTKTGAALGHDVRQNDGRGESRRHDDRHVYGHVLANRHQQMNHPDGASHHDDWDDPGRCAYRRTEERKNLT